MRAGLHTHFLIGMLATMLLVLGIMSGIWWQQRGAAREQAEISRNAMHEMAFTSLKLRGQGLTQLLADALVNPLYYFDTVRIGEIARSALQQPDVLQVIVFDAEGRLVHDGSHDIPGFGQAVEGPLPSPDTSTETPDVRWNEHQVTVGLPIRIGEEHIGGVRIALSSSGMAALEHDAIATLSQQSEQAIGRNLLWMAALFGALLLIGVVISLVLSRGVLRPIRDLAGAARRMESGNFDLGLDSQRKDEIGDLIRAFAHMSDSVSRHDRDIRRIAYGDSLTGLPNRLAFRELLDESLQQAHAGGNELALMFVDLDDFKRINDSLGHDAGDEVLAQFAERIRQGVKMGGDPNAVVARFGGDEFVVRLGARQIHDSAAHVAEAILSELQRPMLLHGRQLFVGASIGITVFPQDGQSSNVLLKNGDIAMYQAKLAGKNCFRFYSKAMDQAVGRRVQIEHDLRGAWERGEMRLVYQPIFRLDNGQLVGAEALLRWQHPELGIIPPSVFIDVAEQSGLIEALGGQALSQACQSALRWVREGSAPFVSVNISARQLRAGNLPEVVAGVLAATGLPPERLHLELTETTVLGDEHQAIDTLARLRELGVKIWLDDFGTGFSGLSHLRRVPVDGVKIDRSFVADVLRDPDDLALTSAIIAMAHSLGITVVGEGVENEGQFAVLKERGCDQAQGYWLGRPMSGSELARRLQA
ncbi:MAG: EAL domain-containing protein [Xanthomonadales bacterium]|nr:EAL domain-containing protein [Xanthomonadales bacterium]